MHEEIRPLVLAIGLTLAATIPAHGAATRVPAAKHSAAEPRVPAKRPATADSSAAPATGTAMTMRGGQEGTVFHDLTVEGEDRVHVDFDRPELKLDLNPEKAPGLSWGSARDVMNRTTPDLAAPFLALSSTASCPYLGRPWLSEFASGSVARFTPDVEGVERWRLIVANSKGETVTSFGGTGHPPRSIAWDGRAQGGQPVTPGITYSYVFEAYDRAGNKRNFVGRSFTVNAYRLDGPDGPTLLFSGRELDASATPAGSSFGGEARGTVRPTPAILLEAASWLNQSAKAMQSVKVTATARTAEQAQTLCALVTRQMTPYLLGDPARVMTATDVQPDAPEGGAVRIAAGR